MPLPRPSAADTKRILAETAETQAIKKATPKRDDVLAVLGKESLITNPDGSWRIQVARPDRPAEENLRRFRAVSDLMSKRWNMETERSKRRDGEANYVRVRDHEGGIRNVSAESESLAAANAGWKPAPVLRTNVRVLSDGTLEVSGVATGHTHMGEPHAWQKASCPGCRK